VSNFKEKLFSQELQNKIWYRSLSLTQNEHDAKDLLQDTFVRALENEDKFNGENIDRWVYTICRNLFLDSKRKKREVLLGDEIVKNTVSDDFETIEVKKDLKYCMTKLSEKDREVISLIQLHEPKEVAEILEVSSGNLRVKLHRARLQLAECLGI
tara:strand:+ start:384 stop:848 length:465 start_codon:yes stop_codon:yes gene_type:complete